MTFNLIPTDSLEYQVYADYLEDQGIILTSGIRQGILLFDTKDGRGEGSLRGEVKCLEIFETFRSGYGYGGGGFWWSHNYGIGFQVRDMNGEGLCADFFP